MEKHLNFKWKFKKDEEYWSRVFGSSSIFFNIVRVLIGKEEVREVTL